MLSRTWTRQSVMHYWLRDLPNSIFVSGEQPKQPNFHNFQSLPLGCMWPNYWPSPGQHSRNCRNSIFSCHRLRTRNLRNPSKNPHVKNVRCKRSHYYRRQYRQCHDPIRRLLRLHLPRLHGLVQQSQRITSALDLLISLTFHRHRQNPWWKSSPLTMGDCLGSKILWIAHTLERDIGRSDYIQRQNRLET